MTRSTQLSHTTMLQRQGSNVAVTVLLKDNNASTVWETKFLLIKSDNPGETIQIKDQIYKKIHEQPSVLTVTGNPPPY